MFNIYDIDNKHYLPWDEVIKITDRLSLNRVPVIYRGTFNDPMTNIDYLMNLSESLEYTPGFPAEGIVVKTDYGKEYGRCSFKVISNKFLLSIK